MTDIRIRAVFHGRVQGVGFRYTARYAAESLGLTGWVKNDWDGSVLMEAQGQKFLVDKLMVRLNTDRFIRVEWVDREEIPLEEGEKSFKIKY